MITILFFATVFFFFLFFLSLIITHFKNARRKQRQIIRPRVIPQNAYGNYYSSVRSSFGYKNGFGSMKNFTSQNDFHTNMPFYEKQNSYENYGGEPVVYVGENGELFERNLHRRYNRFVN